MFLKSVKLEGILGINGTKSYDFHFNESREEFQDCINNIADFNAIQGILLIFDAKYDDKFDFKDIINHHKQQSYVELSLHQKKEQTYCQSEWIGKTDVTIKRIFQQPQVIFIDDKKCDIKVFHKSLASTGFHSNIQDLCIHRVLNEDISMFSRYSGDDFWNMLVSVIEHEELIDSIEYKAGVVKKRALTKSFDIISDAITNEIPRKLEVRELLYNTLQQNKTFQTSFMILNERKLAFLESQKNAYATEIQELKPRIIESNLNKYDASKTNDLLVMKIDRSKQDLQAIIDAHTELEFIVETYMGESDTFHLANLIQFYENLKTPQPTSFGDLKNFVNQEIATMKFCLAKSIETGKFDSTKSLFTSFHHHCDAFLKMFGSAEATATIIENENTFNENLIPELEQEYLDSVIKSLDALPTHLEESENKLQKIYELMADLEISHESFETLVSIEKIIKSCPDLQTDYLGPVYRYLRNVSELDAQSWIEISSVANKILFKTSDNLMNFLEKLLDEKAPTASYSFVSIDNLAVRVFDENIQNTDRYLSLEKLIKPNVDMNLKNAIFTLLLNYLEHESNSLIIQSDWNNIWEMKGLDPVDAAKDYYKLVGEYVAIEEEIMHSSPASKTLEFEEKKVEILNEEVEKACSYTVGKEDSQILNAMKDVYNQMGELLAVSQEECQNWNLDELKRDMKNIEGESIYSYYGYVQQLANQNRHFIQESRSKINQILCSSGESYNPEARKAEIQATVKFQQLADKSNWFKEMIHDKCQHIINLCDSIEWLVEDFDKYRDEMKNFGDLCAKNILNDLIIENIKEKNEEIFNDDQCYGHKCYTENKNRSTNIISKSVQNTYKDCINMNHQNGFNMTTIDPDYYLKVAESIKNLKKYSTEDMYIPMRIKKRAYPLLNVMVVKILKDTVYNFTATYNLVLSNFISHSHLFFYTQTALNEIDDTQFSWNCFHISRLKSIDFVEKWKDSRKILPLSQCQLIKSLLLVLHIINYISIFKFIIISEKVFVGMNSVLVNQLRNFFKTISPFVQIILYKDDPEEDTEDRLMESDSDLISQ